ncbi:MAG: 50S ribosomal protein L25 [Nitrospirales bacterium]|nr:MAG: 50S ribosomal protein L25 [Nitrospirales bacterium]
MKFEINVQRREKAGKGPARELRRLGRIPAVLYGSGQSLLLSMEPKVARDVILSQVGHTGLLTVQVTGDGKQEQRVAVLQDYQLDPIIGTILHVDLFEVSMDKPLRVKVPVTIMGETPIGVKEGGVLQNVLREFHIECLPAQIPDHIEVDTSNLNIGEGFHVKDVVVPEGVKVLDDEELMVTHVVAKISEAKLEALLSREVEEGGQAEPKAEGVDKDKAEAAAPTGDAKGESKAKEAKK